MGLQTLISEITRQLYSPRKLREINQYSLRVSDLSNYDVTGLTAGENTHTQTVYRSKVRATSLVRAGNVAHSLVRAMFFFIKMLGEIVLVRE